LTNSIAQVSASGRRIIWTNCLTDISADIVATYRKSGLECDLIFRQRAPAPSEFGMSTNCRVQLLTEFFDMEDPVAEPLPATEAPGLTDATLKFGATRMGRGRAFSTGADSPDSPTDGSSTTTNSGPAHAHAPQKSMRIFKSWRKVGNRSFLIEEAPYSSVASELDKLAVADRPSSRLLASGRRLRPGLALPGGASEARRKGLAGETPALPGKALPGLQIADARLFERPGFVWDFVETSALPTLSPFEATLLTM